VHSILCLHRSQLAQAPRNHEARYFITGTCRNGLPAGALARAWRVRVPDVSTRFYDRIHGDLQQNLAHDVGDFIVKRADGLFAYQLRWWWTMRSRHHHVVRGADLLWNTPRQIYLQSLLGCQRRPTPMCRSSPTLPDKSCQADPRARLPEQGAPP